MTGKVLLIDDDDDVREIITMVLEAGGFEVDAARDGRTALERMRTRPPPAMVLLDLRMPGINGEEFMRVSGDYLKSRDVPVILMSGDADAEQLAAKVGATGYLQKPVEFDDLLSVVRRYGAVTQPEAAQ